MASRRLLVPAITALAVVAIAAGAGIVASRDNTDGQGASSAALDSPKLPALSIDGGRDGMAEAAAAAPQLGAPAAADTAAGKIGAPVSGSGMPTVTIKGELPTATDALVPAYKLSRRGVGKEDVAKLAGVFGIKGEPVAQAGSWQLAADGKYLSVDPSPTLDWRFGPGDLSCGYATTAVPADGAGVEGSAPNEGSTGAGAAGGVETPPSAAIAVDPKAPQVTTEGPDTPVTDVTRPAKEQPSTGADGNPLASANPAGDAPAASGGPAVTPMPAPCSGGVVTSEVACAAPDGAEPVVECPTQPKKPLATEAQARAAALALLKKLDVTAEGDDVRVEEGYDGVRQVSVRRRVDGRPVEGLSLQIGVDATGTVINAAGQLAEPVVAGGYPMLPPAELAQGLANSRMTTMLCEQKPGVEGCAPPPPLVVTGAKIGLSLVYPADFEKGEAYLLPAWLFTLEGDPYPIAVVALPDQYRTDPRPLPGNDGGTIEPAPMPPSLVDPPVVDPGSPQPDQPRLGSAEPPLPSGKDLPASDLPLSPAAK